MKPQKLIDYPFLSSVIGIALLSRVVFFTVIFLVASVNLDVVPAREGSTFHLVMNQDFQVVIELIKKTLLSADASWYLEIAQYGYPSAEGGFVEPKHWVFFPAFPMLVACFAKIVGHPLLVACLLNNLLFVVSLAFLSSFLVHSKFSKQEALFVTALLAFHPQSYFFSTPHSESLFFFSLVVVFYGLQQGGRLLVYTALAILLLTRPTGLLCLPAILAYLLYLRRTPVYILSLALSFVPFLFFELHLWDITGRPLIWIENQKAWGRGGGELWVLGGAEVESFSPFFSPWSFNGLHWFFLASAIVASFWCLAKKNFSFALLILVPLLASLSTGTLWSLSRILMPIFPISLFYVKTFRRSLLIAYLAVSIAIFAILSLLYALHVSIAMT